jgi:hypothetical protein
LQSRYGEYGFVPVFASVSVLYATAIVVEWLFFRKGRRITPLPDDEGESVGDMQPVATK